MNFNSNKKKFDFILIFFMLYFIFNVFFIL